MTKLELRTKTIDELETMRTRTIKMIVLDKKGEVVKNKWFTLINKIDIAILEKELNRN